MGCSSSTPTADAAAACTYAKEGDLNKLKNHIQENPNHINARDGVSNVYTNIIDIIYIITMNFISIIIIINIIIINISIVIIISFNINIITSVINSITIISSIITIFFRLVSSLLSSSL